MRSTVQTLNYLTNSAVCRPDFEYHALLEAKSRIVDQSWNL